MRTIKAVIKKYKTLYPDVEVKQKGSWIQIDGKSYRSKDVLQMINDYKQPIHTTEPATAKQILSTYEAYNPYASYEPPEPKPDPPEPIKLVKQIYEKANSIRHSGRVSQMRKDGHDIAKLAKRLSNIMGE